jgi:hypothetical protein
MYLFSLCSWSPGEGWRGEADDSVMMGCGWWSVGRGEPSSHQRRDCKEIHIPCDKSVIKLNLNLFDVCIHINWHFAPFMEQYRIVSCWFFRRGKNHMLSSLINTFIMYAQVKIQFREGKLG